MMEQIIKSRDIHYRDFWFRLIGSLVASEMIDSLGREESFFRRLTHPYFYVDLLGGFIIALILWEMVRFATRGLDRRFDWFEFPVQRVSLQLFFAVIVPAFLCFIFTLIFMKVTYNQDIFKTEWLYNEFYAAILIIVLVNVVYFTWGLFTRWEAIRRTAHPLSAEESEWRTVSAAEAIKSMPVSVTKAGKTILLPQEDIAYVLLDNNYTFIKTIEGESYVTNYTLDELVKFLNTHVFFRANRQVIVSRQVCRSYESIEHGKISIELSTNGRMPVIVSQKKAKSFRRWMANVANN